MIDLKKLIGFDWDKGNLDKSYQKHGITPNETEDAVADENVFLQEDLNHSQKEERFIAIGKTSKEKMLFTIFTVRNNRVRVISSRIANKKERRLYEKET